MFEVGKKYKHSAGVVRDCVYSSASVIVLRDVSGKDYAFSSIRAASEWSEYRELVVSKFVRHVSVDRTDLETWRDIHNIDTEYGDVYVGSVEFTVTDGKLTDVKIL